jgi:hypothetical protein
VSAMEINSRNQMIFQDLERFIVDFITHCNIFSENASSADFDFNQCPLGLALTPSQITDAMKDIAALKSGLENLQRELAYDQKHSHIIILEQNEGKQGNR